MISLMYEILDTAAKWCERNEGRVRRIVGNVRRGWDEAEGDHKTVAEAWAEGGIDHGGFTKEEIEEEETKLERELRRRKRKEREPSSKHISAGRLPSGPDSLGVERPGTHCNHGNVPSVGDEVVTVGGEVLRANGNNDVFPAAPPPRTREGSPVVLGRTCAVAGCGLTATMGSLCATHFVAQEESTPGGKLHARHSITGDETAETVYQTMGERVRELLRRLEGLGKLSDRKPGPARVQLMRASIDLIEEVDVHTMRELLKYQQSQLKVSGTLQDIARAALHLNSNTIRHTIICMLHNRSRIPELANWWPEQWYADVHLDNGIEAFCNEPAVFTLAEIEYELQRQYPGRLFRPGSWKNAVDRWKRAGKLQPLGHNVYQPVEKEG